MIQLLLDILGIKRNNVKSQAKEMFQLPLKDIRDFITNDNKYVAIFRVSPVNGDLLPEEQLESLTDSIQGALSTFDGRIGIYIQSETINIESNIENIEKRKQMLNNEFKISLLELQKNHLSTLVNKSRNVLCFYIALEIKADSYFIADQLLSDHFNNFKNELESVELYCDLLREHDIKELLYARLNPVASLVEPYNEAWGIQQILPSNAVIYEDGRHIEIENRIYRFFSFSFFPVEVDKYRWLRKVFNINGDLNVAIILTPKNKATIQKELSKAVEEMGRRAKDDTQKEYIKQEYAQKEESARQMIAEIGNDNVNLYDCNITISISAKNMNELNTLATSLRSKISSCYCQSVELKRKGFDPLFTTLPILPDNSITRNFVWNLSSRDVASLIPFDSSEFMEEYGTQIGENVSSGGVVIVNYQNKIYNNGHLCILADTGFGKTFFLMLDAMRNIPYVDYTIMFDLKGDLIFPWGKRYIFSATSGLITNPFHFRNAIIDSESDVDNGRVDVGVFLQQKIMDVIVFFKWIIRDLNSYDESILLEDIQDAYRECGLDYSSKELPDKFCTMSDLKTVQDRKIANSDGMEKERRTYLRACLKPYTEGAYACMFNGQTNWDFDEFTVFVLSNAPEAVKKPLYDILLKDTWQFIKKDGTKRPTIKRTYVDECHEFADPKNPQTLEFISTKLSKQSRGFGNYLITATQNLPDFLSIPKHGQAIIDNSYFKLFGRLGESDLPEVRRLYKFSDAEMRILKGSTSRRKSGKGRGIFVIGSQRVVVQVRASKLELEIIDPKQYEDIYGVPSRFSEGKRYEEVM